MGHPRLLAGGAKEEEKGEEDAAVLGLEGGKGGGDGEVVFEKGSLPTPTSLRHKQKSRYVTHSQTILHVQHQLILCDWIQIKVLSRLTSLDPLKRTPPGFPDPTTAL
ncbi:hypothetical protein H671_5g14995 [Cricetulus griseus]|uniref:Uncharacterized protein n=1 Tax=Cricetulus griseus TaxID=10029 RepID=A0A061I380_CRIGR|nr:hypothetical protein H671_5g14995 [Cricetulus griseus]